MADNLVIVESPAKAKTIEKFLGKEYIVKSSYGHVRDLVKKDAGIDITNNFEPVYEISDDKKHVIKELSKLSKDAKTVWLATDEDREGEAISWHLAEVLGLNKKNTRRIVFHEITKTAILEAIENPRDIDQHLVNAQQARRVLDRLVGFELSPILWRKIKPSLSAGRVQSVAVRLIVEREREIDAFNITTYYKVSALFDVNSKTFKADLDTKFENQKQAEDFLSTCRDAQFSVENLEVKPGKRSPSAPFTTSTLQQEASRKLGFSVSQTMRVAQSLYENGLITYMRTDSVNLSGLAIGAAKKEIINNYGEQYHQVRQYKTKSASAQEAHEAIRPTYLNRTIIDGDNSEQRLYDLIWKRTLASQMADAQIEKTTVTIKNDKSEHKFIGTAQVIKFDGFLKLYIESTDDENAEEEEAMLPQMNINDSLSLKQMNALQRFTYPPARYTEASLVKKLEELGIGRPSTYAPTISTIQKRNYVLKEERIGKERQYISLTLKDNNITTETKTETTGTEKGKLFPTDIGAVVNDFLVENFKEILDYNFTAYVEGEFDLIAEGKMEWHEMLNEFYKPFHQNVVNTIENAERASGERELGTDPKTGKRVIVRLGRYGPLVQIGEGEDAKYAGIRTGQRMESINLEEALDLFKLPRNIGQFEGEDVIVSIGKFGPYARHGEKVFYSLPKDDDPYTIELNRVIEIIEDKRSKPDLIKNPLNLGQYNNDDIIVSRGRFGPYIKNNKLFVSIPRGEDPFSIDQEKAIELIQKKEKSDAEKVIKIFPEDDNVKILSGRWGAYLVIGKKNFRLPKDKEPSSLTLDECLKIAGSSPSSKGKKSKFAGKKKSGADSEKKVTAKKTSAKKPPVKTKKK